MCRIGLTGEGQDTRAMFEPCLTAGHRTFSERLWSGVPSSAWVSLLTVAHSASRSRLMVGGDVSTSVTLTLSSTG